MTDRTDESVRLDTIEGRAKLAPRPNAPYAHPLRKNIAVTLRVNDTYSTWQFRYRLPGKTYKAGHYEWHTLGALREHTDPKARRDGFAFEEAVTAGERHLAHEIEKLANPEHVNPETGAAFSVADCCTLYVEHKRKTNEAACAHEALRTFERWVIGRAGQINSYGRRLQDCPRAKLADILVSRLVADDLLTWRHEILTTEDDEGELPTVRYVNRIMTTLRAALNHAKAARKAPRRLADEVELVKQLEEKDEGTGRDLFLNRERRSKFIAAAPNVYVRNLMAATALIGARPGELTSMKAAQFCAETRTVKFYGKTRGREIPIEGAALEFFTRLAAGKRRAELLFPRNAAGEPYGHSGWDGDVKAAARAAELPDAILYTLRHSFITQLALDNVPLLQVAKYTGTSLAMIQKTYGKFVPSEMRESLKLHQHIELPPTV